MIVLILNQEIRDDKKHNSQCRRTSDLQGQKKAQSEHTTLNARFRQWLDRYTTSNIDNEYDRLMDQLSHVRASGPFSRDELNER